MSVFLLLSTFGIWCRGAQINVSKAWILYDVANSAYILLATSLIPIYFSDLAASAGLDKTQYLSYWAASAAIVTMVMLILGPTMGTLSDRHNWRKPLFITVVLVGVFTCILLGLPKWWLTFLILFIISKIAFNASLVIYDGMLNDIATDEEMDHISSKGYALGYIGSCIPFVVCLVFVVLSDMMDSTPNIFSFEAAVAISLVITGIWWLIMSLPLFKEYEQKRFNKVRNKTWAETFDYTMGTIKDIAKNRAMLMFLIAFFFYIDGVNTTIELSAAYGEALDLGSIGLLGALFITQVVAFPSTLFMSKMSYRYGTHRIIYLAIGGYIVVSVFALFLDNIWQFFILACFIGLFQGTIQALSRAYFGRMVPKDKTGEYFGIMDVFGKGATIIGTTSIAILTSLLGEIRVVAMILLFMFIIGLIFFRASVRERIYDVPTTEAG